VLGITLIGVVSIVVEVGLAAYSVKSFVILSNLVLIRSTSMSKFTDSGVEGR
jgi:hypothetical protein